MSNTTDAPCIEIGIVRWREESAVRLLIRDLWYRLIWLRRLGIMASGPVTLLLFDHAPMVVLL
jgi:hypothetical protein